jgi:nucleoside-diphosphate-sugar epimerase
MIILSGTNDSLGRQVIAIFGVGLIGGALTEKLKARWCLLEEKHDLDWNDFARQSAQLHQIENRLSQALQPRDGVSFNIVWSAGRANFTSTSEPTSRELQSFKAILELAERLAGRCPWAPSWFHLISSAGGLFEGQRLVNQNSAPAPLRPYGVMKLEQEQMLASFPVPVVKTVYRLTSVYGRLGTGPRKGLIATLVHNGLGQQLSTIMGQMTTLRDFTWVEDVADFIAGKVMSGSPELDNAVYTLPSGCPSSIHAIQKMIEHMIGRPLYVHYLPAPTNCEDITFSHQLMPQGWLPSDLRTNIRNICRQALGGATPSSRLRESSDGNSI